MKKAILMLVVFLAIVAGVLGFTNVLQTWELDSDSVGEISENFFGVGLSNGFQTEGRVDSLRSWTYGGTYVLQLNITNTSSPEDSVKESYDKLGSSALPASEDAYQQISELFGLSSTEIKTAYHKKTELKRELYAFSKPDHADVWVVFTTDGAEKYMYLGYSEEACSLTADADSEE